MFVEDFVPIQPSLDEMYGYTGTLDGDAMTSFNSGWAHDGNGGYYFPEWPDGSDDGVIVVPGSLPGIQVYLDDLLALGLTFSDLYPGGTVPQPDGGEGSDDKSQGEDPASDCVIDAHAKDAADGALSVNPPGSFGPFIPDRNNPTWRDAELVQLIGPDGTVPFTNPEGGTVDRLWVVGLGAGIAQYMPETDLIQGMVHSHPATIYDGTIGEYRNLTPEERADNRYPSSADWAALTSIAKREGGVTDPSLYLIGPDGVTREFKLSERTKFEALTDEDRQNGAGLEGGELTDEDGEC